MLTSAPYAAQVQKTKSWYGSLPRKSTASTSLQRETIITGSPLKAGSTPDFHRYDLKKTGDNASLSGASSASVNAPSKLHNATPVETQSSTTDPDPSSQMVSGNGTTERHNTGGATETTDGAGLDADTPMPDAPPTCETSERPQAASGWLGGWFGWTQAPPENPPQAQTQVPTEPPKEAEPEPPVRETTALLSNEQPASATIGQRAASWLWPNTTAVKNERGEHAKPSATSAAGKDAEDSPMKDAAPAAVAAATAAATAASEPAPKPSAGSTWAYWWKDTPKPPGLEPEPHNTGQLAVVGERSERHPKRANSTDMSREPPAKPAANLPKEPPLKPKQGKEKGKKSKRNRPPSMDLEDTPSGADTPLTDSASIKTSSPTQAKTKTPTSATKREPPNLLLPAFRGTYQTKDNPSIMNQIASLLLRTQQPTPKHVFLAKDPPKIKRAIAIGVHGLFPATFLRPVIGQPTGTSLKFAQHGADAIRRWAHSHGYADSDLVIENIAIECEGKIDSRVTNMWNLLQNWMDSIRAADFVLFACHSQGVPVSLIALQRLIESGAVDRARIGVCAMAGVSLGPFAEYKGGMGMLMGSAAELWEFADRESAVSKRYEAAVKRVLQHPPGVRITYVGSIDDQLVPLESAIYSPASHPYIYRAIFIDGRLHASDFIAHLVGFACKLRNLGVSDHGLIRELSVPLAGSLYGGEGHSRLYDDAQVYDVAISHALETTNIPTAPAVASIPCTIKHHTQPTTTPNNPYILPWIMRGLLEEPLLKEPGGPLNAETDALLRQFDDWKPTTKPLKDVKFRLEAVRSRL
ncbi:unnamed protein product [Discula destructiva]